MATFVQAITGFNSAGSNANLFTSNFVSLVTAGNMIVVVCCLDAANATIDKITDNLGNNYAFLSRYTSGILTIISYFGYVRTGGTLNVQVTENFIDGQIFAQEWSGMTTVDPLDATASATGTSAATTSGNAIATIVSNAVVFNTIMLGNQTNTYGLGTGWTNLSSTASNFTSSAIESQATTTAGTTVTGSFTMSNTGTTYIMHSFAVPTSNSVGGADTGGQFGQAIDASSGISTSGGIH